MGSLFSDNFGSFMKAGASATGAAIGIANSIAAARSAKKARNQLDRSNAFNDSMFDKRYYQDMMARSEIQNALNLQRANAENQSRINSANAVMNGSTPEIAAAQQQMLNNSMSNTISNLAANMSTYKDNILNNYIGAKNKYFEDKANSFMDQSNQQSQAAANGFQAMGQAMQG